MSVHYLHIGNNCCKTCVFDYMTMFSTSVSSLKFSENDLKHW